MLQSILLASCLALLVVLLFMSIRISQRLGWLLRKMGETNGEGRKTDIADIGPSVAEPSSGGAFEAFLSEDPSRRELPKAEQFSAYRLWRQEKGMNWSNSRP